MFYSLLFFDNIPAWHHTVFLHLSYPNDTLSTGLQVGDFCFYHHIVQGNILRTKGIIILVIMFAYFDIWRRITDSSGHSDFWCFAPCTICTNYFVFLFRRKVAEMTLFCLISCLLGLSPAPSISTKNESLYSKITFRGWILIALLAIGVSLGFVNIF